MNYDHNIEVFCCYQIKKRITENPKIYFSILVGEKRKQHNTYDLNLSIVFGSILTRKFLRYRTNDCKKLCIFEMLVLKQSKVSMYE